MISMNASQTDRETGYKLRLQLCRLTIVERLSGFSPTPYNNFGLIFGLRDISPAI